MNKSKTYQSPDDTGRKNQPCELVLHNDDFNTFDFVIDALVKVCNHEPDQAHQCALITHFNGKCTVKTATYSELKPLQIELSKKNLSVSIN
jgi:ATP-dependent Clp protease adaptor protein ClpS